MDQHVELISRRRVFDGFLKIDEAELRIGGQLQRRLSVERGDSAAAVVSRVDDGAILLTRQFRYPTFDKGPGYLLELPAGTVEDGEDPARCLERELVEELGYRPERIEPIGVFYVSPGGSSERIHLYHAEVSAEGRVGDGGGLAEEGEDIEIVAVSIDELRAMVADGTIVDAKTIIGACWLDRRAEG